MSIVISGQHLSEKKHVWVALMSIYGIGKTTAQKICEQTAVDADVQLGSLSQDQVEQLRSAIGDLKVEGDLRREIAINIKREMDMGSYVGIRHRRGLPVNGQRTKTNAQTRKRRRKK